MSTTPRTDAVPNVKALLQKWEQEWPTYPQHEAGAAAAAAVRCCIAELREQLERVQAALKLSEAVPYARRTNEEQAIIDAAMEAKP